MGMAKLRSRLGLRSGSESGSGLGSGLGLGLGLTQTLTLQYLKMGSFWIAAAAKLHYLIQPPKVKSYLSKHVNGQADTSCVIDDHQRL